MKPWRPRKIPAGMSQFDCTLPGCNTKYWAYKFGQYCPRHTRQRFPAARDILKPPTPQQGDLFNG